MASRFSKQKFQLARAYFKHDDESDSNEIYPYINPLCLAGESELLKSFDGEFHGISSFDGNPVLSTKSSERGT